MLKRKSGQGVVEYAGAIVVATAIVVAALTLAPNAVGTMFTSVITKISTYLTGKVP